MTLNPAFNSTLDPTFNPTFNSLTYRAPLERLNGRRKCRKCVGWVKRKNYSRHERICKLFKVLCIVCLKAQMDLEALIKHTWDVHGFRLDKGKYLREMERGSEGNPSLGAENIRRALVIDAGQVVSPDKEQGRQNDSDGALGAGYRSGVVQDGGPAGGTDSAGVPDTLFPSEGQEGVGRDDGRGYPSTPGMPTGNEEVIYTDDRQRMEAGMVNKIVRGRLGHSLVTPLEETQKWIQWLKDMRNREWPPSLEDSWYKDLISRLYTITEKAEPAVTEDGTRPLSSNLQCLTMQGAKAKLEEPRSEAKPILIKGDDANKTTTSLGTIESFLEWLGNSFENVSVNDLGRRRDDPSAISWTIGNVKQRFREASNPEEVPPINLLDVSSILPRVPECFCSPTMQFLAQLDLESSDAGRSVKPVESRNWMNTEKWHLLGQGGSGSSPHQDHCGLWTWVRVDVGKKLWLICQLSDDDRKGFSTDGPAFTGGQWSYVWLEAGDILIMPPGTVHAVFTPENTLCTGGNGWSKSHMGNTANAFAFEKEFPQVTNDNPIPQISVLLDNAWKLMNRSGNPANEFGGQGQVDQFSRYYKTLRPSEEGHLNTKGRSVELVKTGGISKKPNRPSKRKRDTSSLLAPRQPGSRRKKSAKGTDMT